MTAEDLAALEAEIERLETVERVEIAERIRTAREWGDLKENAEYHDAKNSQAHLETRILLLVDKRRKAEVREAPAASDTVVFGSRVELRDEATGNSVVYTLVSSLESDAASGRLSFDSPVAQALEGSRAGSTVTVRTPRGARTLTVLAIG